MRLNLVPASNATAEQRTEPDAREEPKRRTRAAPRLRVAAQKVSWLLEARLLGPEPPPRCVRL
jgi:hypothetical protein